MTSFAFDNTYKQALSGFYASTQPEQVPSPELVYINTKLAESLNLNLNAHSPIELAAFFSGNQLPSGAEPIAQAYAGHQFGQFNPHLGDGRALILGEIVNPERKRFDICLKGSGRTSYSRGGDGKAALGPMLREVLVGEAMHALAVPTTRSLAVAATGEAVYRDEVLPGAILTRVAASHIRIGTFQFFAARGEGEPLKRLADYTIARHDPELLGTENPYLGFLYAVAKRHASLIAQWMGLGFIHGVMNTDNMSIAGETIDYGPCAFLETYNPAAVFSSIDAQGRYSYQNQPNIARWNLARLAETLLPLLADDQQEAITLATAVIDEFPDFYQECWLDTMMAKLGLGEQRSEEKQVDQDFVDEWLALLEAQEVDFTLAWRRLADVAEGREAPLRELFTDQASLDSWLDQWQERCANKDPATRAKAMRQVNPWLIPRNHHVEEALAAASNDGDLGPFEQLLDGLTQPYCEDARREKLAEPAPRSFTTGYKTFCGT